MGKDTLAKNRRQNATFGRCVPLELLEFEEVLEKYIQKAGITKRRLANLIGCNYSNLKRMCNPKENYYPNIKKVMLIDEILMEKVGFPPLTEWLARQLGYTLQPLEDHPMVPSTTPEQDACKTMMEAGSLIKEIAQALEDGVIQPEEAEELLAHIEESEAALGRLKSKLKKLLEG